MRHYLRCLGQFPAERSPRVASQPGTAAAGCTPRANPKASRRRSESVYGSGKPEDFEHVKNAPDARQNAPRSPPACLAASWQIPGRVLQRQVVMASSAQALRAASGEVVSGQFAQCRKHRIALNIVRPHVP
jgi:hypothetical protein